MATNKSLNWMLMAYLDPTACLGVGADHIMAEATLSTLRERASHFAWRLGFTDPEIGNDALSSMLLWVATSTIAECFQPALGTPRRYINKILFNFVALEIRKRYRRPAKPLHDDLQSRDIDPAKAAEIYELGEVCQKLIAEDDNDNSSGSAVSSSSDKPTTANTDQKNARSAMYFQRHRRRKLLWAQIESHFPELKMRPRKRRRRRNSKQAALPEQATRHFTPTPLPAVCSGPDQG